jgi:hypothetical protein
MVARKPMTQAELVALGQTAVAWEARYKLACKRVEAVVVENHKLRVRITVLEAQLAARPDRP